MSALSHATGGTRKPQSRLWYLAAVVAALAGFVFAGLYAYGRLDDVTKGLTQIVVPGEAVLTLEPGHYTIFHESQSVVDGRIFSSTDVAGLAVSVEPVSGAPALALRAPGTASSYEISGRSGRSVLVFDVTEPGEYHVAAGYPDGEKQAQAVLAVGRDAVGKILWLVFSAIGIVFLGVGSAVAIAVMVYRRRRAALATPERSRFGKAGGLALLTWLVALTPVSAEDANPCADATTTIEIRECLDKAYTSADAELNAVWKEVMARVGGADYLPAKERNTWKDELLTSQRAWIQFKEHDCDAVGFEWYGGTGASGAILSCLLEHTEARTKDLKARYLDR